MITELKTFLAVAKFRSFVNAGKQIGLSQSAVSAQMQRLETALDRELFERGPKSVKLNDAGWLLIPEAEALLQQWLKMKDETNRDSGTLRVGSIHSFQAPYVTPCLDKFIATFPQWKVRVIPDVSISLLSKIEADELDAAILIKPSFELPKHLLWKTITKEPFSLIVPAETTSTDWQEPLHHQPFIRYYHGSFGGRIVDRFLNVHNISVNDCIEIDDIQSMVDLVARGLGVALVPGNQIDLKGCQSIPLGENTFYREIGIITPLSSEKVRHTKYFIETMQQSLIQDAEPVVVHNKARHKR